MFDDVLIESAGKDKTKGRGVTALVSAVIHVVIIGALIAANVFGDTSTGPGMKSLIVFVMTVLSLNALRLVIPCSLLEAVI